MKYLAWALGAMVSYSFVFLFVKLAQRELPTFTVMTIAIVVLMSLTTAVTLVTGQWQPPIRWHSIRCTRTLPASDSRVRSSATFVRSRLAR